MRVLRISLFGGVRIAHDGQISGMKVTRIVQTLLAYLLLQRHRSHPREVLAGLFWGDHSQERARSCLSTALWRLRRVLEPEGTPRGTYLMTTPAGEIGFNRESDHWLDVAVFEEQVGRVLAKPIHAVEAAGVRELESALQLYRGELLEGFYDDWALRERERLRCLYLNSLAHLMRYYKHHGAYEQSLAYGQQILH
ncbi:MAG: BTAD domain-containing putative transcriptional regulator, partial [Anaerolineae bacterium]